MRGKLKGVEDELVARFRKGDTMRQLASRYGVTVSAVSCCLKRHSVNASEGGGRLRSAALKEKAAHSRDSKYLEKHGCTWQEYWSVPPTARLAYRQQRKNANQRGVEWRITLVEWWGVWVASGKFELRGRGRGKYVMARSGDVGPYAVENVEIADAVQNNSDGRAVWRAGEVWRARIDGAIREFASSEAAKIARFGLHSANPC